LEMPGIDKEMLFCRQLKRIIHALNVFHIVKILDNTMILIKAVLLSKSTKKP
jgi:hypothetical protein